MSSYSAEEVVEGLEKWLKTRRDDCGIGTIVWIATDSLLDEVRDRAAEGWLPWERLGEDE